MRTARLEGGLCRVDGRGLRLADLELDFLRCQRPQPVAVFTSVEHCGTAASVQTTEWCQSPPSPPSILPVCPLQSLSICSGRLQGRTWKTPVALAAPAHNGVFALHPDSNRPKVTICLDFQLLHLSLNQYVLSVASPPALAGCRAAPGSQPRPWPPPSPPGPS